MRALPPVHAVLAHPGLDPWIRRVGRDTVRSVVQRVLAELRGALRGTATLAPGLNGVVDRALAMLAERARPGLRRAVNATGIVLHTGLGRAPLAEEAARAAHDIATGYCNLEFDLDSGDRGDRNLPVADRLRAVTGAGAAIVVNNNAAAVLLVLGALAAPGEVVVSRGELVEIGGSFRVPEVMAQSGARLREVGTTNRTHARDYAAALGPETALLLKVHQSNFRIVGFTTAPSLEDLASVAGQAGVPLAYDMGSGALVSGLGDATPSDPAASEVRAALTAGADVVTFSGDKLLGGPQAGIICGRADLVRKCAAHPLYRALRVDKMTLAALGATLDLYRSGRARQAVPALRMLDRSPDELTRAAGRLARALRREVGGICAIRVEHGESLAGGGSLPERPLPTSVVTLRPQGRGAQALAEALRRGDPPVVARIHADAVLLDPRTLSAADSRALPSAVSAALRDAQAH